MRPYTWLLTLFFAVLAFTAQAALQKPVSVKSPARVPGELVVKFRDAASSRSGRAAVLKTLNQRLGSKAVQEIHPLVTDESLAVIRLRDEKLAEKALEVLQGETSVLYAEPNFIYRAFNLPATTIGIPNDRDFAKQWGMYNLGQADSAGQVGVVGDDIHVMPLWQNGIVGKKNIVVAVIDTGIQWDHPDLAPNLYTNTAEIPGNGKDDDGNGFVDDVHGWNFAENKNTSSDDNGHGTHCAGVIGAVGNNGVGVVGVNWNVSLLPVKFLDANGGGSLEGAINAINYARMMKVQVMSNSWGGGGFSQAMAAAIQAAQAQGIVFTAAAGNDGATNDGDAPTYPASYDLPNIIAVAATDNKDGLADFSNYGVKHVHVAAPGVNVYSTYKGGTYKSLSGTSMATPHVAGITALLLSEHPEWTVAEIKERLIKTSTPVQKLRKKVMAGGRINTYNALYGIIPPSPDPAESLWRSQDQVLESEHPYKPNSAQTWTVRMPGAKYIRVHLEKVELEARYDNLTIETPQGEVLDSVSSHQENYTSEYIKGDTLILRLKSDNSVQEWGFKMDKIQYIMDSPVPR